MAQSSYKFPMVQTVPNENNKYFTEYTKSDDNSGEARNIVASKVIHGGTWMAPNGAGKWDVATPTSEDIALLLQPVRATDSDFASADLTRTVLFSNEDKTMFYAPVTGGTLVPADIDSYYAINATGDGIDAGTKAGVYATGKIFRLFAITASNGLQGVFVKIK